MKHKLDTRTPKKMKNEMSGYSHILHIQYVVRMNALI